MAGLQGPAPALERSAIDTLWAPPVLCGGRDGSDLPSAMTRAHQGDLRGASAKPDERASGTLVANSEQEEIARLRRELEDARRQQAATADVLKAISRSAFDLQAVLDTLVESAASLCDAYDAVLLLKVGDALHRKAHHGPIPVAFTSRPISRDWTAGRALVDCKPVHVHDLTSAGDEFPDGQALALQFGHRTILSVPLLRREEAIGVLAIRRTEVRPFTDSQIELVTTFADQAVIAIENTRLFEEVQARTRDLTEALERQTATSEVLSVISRSKFDIQPVLDTICQTARELCSSESASVFLLQGERLLLTAADRLDPSFEAFLQENPIVLDRGSAAGRAVVDRRTVHIHDIRDDPDFTWAASIAVGKFRTLLGVPLLRDGEPVGVIVLHRYTVAPFDKRQIELVTTFADQAVIAIENTRLFEEVQARTRDLTEALERQTATSEVLGVISRSKFDLQPVLDTICQTARELCSSESASVFLLQGERLLLTAADRL
ncbi:MAG TPA: GAF domain-containing protein, partial [Kiloniellales bacterium]|nr:GAF domain-containing protein [Kiloniellales bacterium]